jgi:hypothetical protein
MYGITIYDSLYVALAAKLSYNLNLKERELRSDLGDKVWVGASSRNVKNWGKDTNKVEVLGQRNDQRRGRQSDSGSSLCFKRETRKRQLDASPCKKL